MASPLIAMTMGIVVVACLAARVPGVPWVTAHASELAVIFGNTVRRTRLGRNHDGTSSSLEGS
jgi:hypothetical protein